jgi:hypothetical protein
MNHDLLLLYLTELGEGDWLTFRRAVKHLSRDDDERVSVIARHLGMLGHVEFALENDLRWMVCPPTLAELPANNSEQAVLCGARGSGILHDVQDNAAQLGATVNIHPQIEGPASILITASSNAMLRQLADATRMVYAPNAAERITQWLPTLDDYLPLCVEAAEPSGYDVEVFDHNAMNWVEALQTAADGLYKYDCYGPPEYRLKMAGHCVRVNREVGVYRWLRDHRIIALSYHHETHELSVPVRAPLPDLHARVATLASGFLPDFKRVERIPLHIFKAIPATIAQRILRSLNQLEGAQL